MLRPLTNLLTTANVDLGQKERMEIWLLSYDVAIRRSIILFLSSCCAETLMENCQGKLLQALTFLTHAQTLDSSYPGLHLRLVHLHHFIRTTYKDKTPPAPIGPAFIEGVKQLGVPDENQVSLETYNMQYLQKHTSDTHSKCSAEAVVACAKAMRILGSSVGEVEELLFGSLRDNAKNQTPRRGCLTIQIALEMLELLTEMKSERVDEFRQRCQARFERSTVFGTAEEITKLRESVLATPDNGQKDELL